MLERLISHHRAEIRAANANVDHIADTLPGMAFPRAAPDAVTEVGHLVEHGMHVEDDVLAIHDDRSVFRRAQGCVQDSAVLRKVDLVPLEHRLNALGQTGFGRQFQEEFEGPRTLDEILLPFRKQVAQSGMSDAELDQFYEGLRDEAW